MADVGRPLKFTPERRASILQDIADAIPYELAAQSNGICEDTLYDWIKHGFRDINQGIDSEYAKFSEAIKKVEADRIKRHSNKISENVDRWQADAWMLERRWYRHYGSNVHLHELEDRMKKVEQETADKDESSGQETQKD